jgi:peptide/nickel transport system permease protein
VSVVQRVDRVETVGAGPGQTLAAEGIELQERNRTLRALRRDPTFWVGAVLVAMVVLAAVLAPVIAPHDPLHEYRELMPTDGTALGPSTRFLLGTDHAGRDELSRVIFGARTSLVVALSATILASGLGVLVGVVAGYGACLRIPLPRGRAAEVPLEDPLMRLTDVALAFPILLLAIALTASVGPSPALVVVLITIALWTGTARLVYGRALVLRNAEFVEAAHALGCTGTHIIRRHLLPHLLPMVMVVAAMGIGTAILLEATLSYLGVGIAPPTPTWGRMIAESIGYYQNEPRLLLVPGAAIVLTVAGFSLLGDALGHALEPPGRAA